MKNDAPLPPDLQPAASPSPAAGQARSPQGSVTRGPPETPPGSDFLLVPPRPLRPRFPRCSATTSGPGPGTGSQDRPRFSRFCLMLSHRPPPSGILSVWPPLLARACGLSEQDTCTSCADGPPPLLSLHLRSTRTPNDPAWVLITSCLWNAGEAPQPVGSHTPRLSPPRLAFSLLTQFTPHQASPSPCPPPPCCWQFPASRSLCKQTPP